MELSPKIHIFGASGSGVTTLGTALGEHLGIQHLDTDYYYWEPSNPPFQHKTLPENRIRRIQADIRNQHDWVLSGSLCNWGNPLLVDLTIAVYLELDSTIRLKRLRNREVQRYGDRIKPGGDMHKQHLEFIAWAKSYDHAKAPIRSYDLHKIWMKDIQCPILKLDSSQLICH